MHKFKFLNNIRDAIIVEYTEELNTNLLPYFTTNDHIPQLTTIILNGIEYLEFSITFLPLLNNIGWILNLDLDEINEYFESHDAAKSFSTSNPLFLTTEQHNMVISKILNKIGRGLVQVRTGYGKTELMIYLTATYLGKGGKLILTDSNQVRNEILTRFRKYGIDPESINTKILNPISFLRSNASKNEDILYWLSTVELIQIDECESIFTSLSTVISMCTSRRIIYGYSASPEKVKGKNLSDYSVIPHINSDAFKVLQYVGFSVSYLPPSKVVDVNIAMYKLAPEKFPAYLNHYDSVSGIQMKQRISQSNLFNNNVIFSFLNNFVLPHTKSCLFIPIKFLIHGDKIYDYYACSPYHIVQWDGNKLRSNKLGDITQDQLRNLTWEGKLDILVASSVAGRGVDFRNIFDIFFVAYTQYNDVIQLIGRCSRESPTTPVTVWMIENKEENTPFYTIMHKSRLKKLRENFNADVHYL